MQLTLGHRCGSNTTIFSRHRVISAWLTAQPLGFRYSQNYCICLIGASMSWLPRRECTTSSLEIFNTTVKKCLVSMNADTKFAAKINRSSPTPGDRDVVSLLDWPIAQASLTDFLLGCFCCIICPWCRRACPVVQQWWLYYFLQWVEKRDPICNGSVFFFLSNLQLDYILSYRT